MRPILRATKNRHLHVKLSQIPRILILIKLGMFLFLCQEDRKKMDSKENLTDVLHEFPLSFRAWSGWHSDAVHTVDLVGWNIPEEESLFTGICTLTHLQQTQDIQTYRSRMCKRLNILWLRRSNENMQLLLTIICLVSQPIQKGLKSSPSSTLTVVASTITGPSPPRRIIDFLLLSPPMTISERRLSFQCPSVSPTDEAKCIFLTCFDKKRTEVSLCKAFPTRKIEYRRFSCPCHHTPMRAQCEPTSSLLNGSQRVTYCSQILLVNTGNRTLPGSSQLWNFLKKETSTDESCELKEWKLGRKGPISPAGQTVDGFPETLQGQKIVIEGDNNTSFGSARVETAVNCTKTGRGGSVQDTCVLNCIRTSESWNVLQGNPPVTPKKQFLTYCFFLTLLYRCLFQHFG